jgi:hypothetical protein
MRRIGLKINPGPIPQKAAAAAPKKLTRLRVTRFLVVA